MRYSRLASHSVLMVLGLGAALTPSLLLNSAWAVDPKSPLLAQAPLPPLPSATVSVAAQHKPAAPKAPAKPSAGYAMLGHVASNNKEPGLNPDGLAFNDKPPVKTAQKLPTVTSPVPPKTAPTTTKSVIVKKAGKAPIVPTLKSSIATNMSQLDVTLGKAQVINLSTPANRVSISNPDVAGVVVISPTQIEVVGKGAGTTNLLIWSEETGDNILNIDIMVNRDVAALAKKIQMIDPGVQIFPVAAEDAVILTGETESAEKAQLVYDLTKAYLDTPTPGGGAAGGAPAPAAMSNAATSNVSSLSAGSATLAPTSAKIINLITVKGQPSTKASMVQELVKGLDDNIELKVVPGFGGQEKVFLNGRVKNATMVSKAVNLVSLFYGKPGIKVLTGQGGNLVNSGVAGATSGTTSTGDFSADSLSAGLVGNFSNNMLHSSVITDESGNVISLLEIEERPQVRCTIKFLEVRKDRRFGSTINNVLRSNGVLGASYGGSFAPSPGPATIAGLLSIPTGAATSQLGILLGSDFATLLSSVITDGDARVLAEPTVTSISGEPASFLAGGEFPIPVISATGQVTIVFKQFGVRLQMLATVTERNTIHMQVTPEVSTLDPASGITLSGVTVPGLRTRRSQGVVEMNNGDFFVMSGLYNDQEQDNYFKTPILGQLPILGSLFRSQDFQRNKTELVIVIHPEVESSMNMSQVEKTLAYRAEHPQDSHQVQVKTYTQQDVDNLVRTMNATKHQSTIFGLRNRRRERELEYEGSQVLNGNIPTPTPPSLSPSMNPRIEPKINPTSPQIIRP